MWSTAPLMQQVTTNDSGSPPPECSVCIANYNGEAFIRDCIDSVLNQKVNFPFEVILHDDCSSDGSVQLVRTTYPNITVIESPNNVGFCESNNRMAEAARGRFFLLLNNDAELIPGALSTLYSYALELGEPAILSLPQYDYETNTLVDRGSLVDLFMNPVPNQDARRREVAMVMGSCLWIPGSLWEALGGFPTWFESLAEDMFLCTAARLRGVSVKVPDASGYRHRQGLSFGGGKVVESALNTTLRRRRLSERNKTFTMWICYPAPWHLIILLAHFPALVGEGIFLSIIRRDFRIWKEIYWYCLKSVWANRHRLAKRRAVEQAERRVGFVDFFSTSTFIPRKLELLLRFGIPTIR